MKLILLLFLPLFSLAQQTYTGTVVDKSTGKAISYATVGLINENKGVSADEGGNFCITSFLANDSIRFSAVGYNPLVVCTANWKNHGIVKLEQSPGLLQKVMVSSKRVPTIVLNKFRGCSQNWYRIGRETIYQIAQRFTTPHQQLQLTSLGICKDGAESVFRIRIYDMDSICQCPSKDLADTIIEVRSKNSHVRLDLNEYNIIIPGKNFFVAIEWVFIPSNEETDKYRFQGVKRYFTFYKPQLRFAKNTDIRSDMIWTLGFNGRWQARPKEQVHNFQITAELR